MADLTNGNSNSPHSTASPEPNDEAIPTPPAPKPPDPASSPDDESHDAPRDVPHDERLDELIADFVEAVERGETPDPAKFVSTAPDLADSFLDFVRNWRQFRVAAATWPQAAAAPASASAGPLVRQVGNYELLEPIARGGMGVIYKARQIPLNRIVAVKMLRDGVLSSPDDVRRFQAEAEAVAQLEHPGIVPIYEVGQHEGLPFFSMRYVPGENLADLVARGPVAPRDAARLVMELAQILEFAHRRHVIHRDLKPSNVLLENIASDDLPASAKRAAGPGGIRSWLTPRVTDFGLAKRTSASNIVTHSGAILGTPSYMAPEQIMARSSTIGPAADIYSLGGILYCLLTGRPPFQAADPLVTLQQVCHDEPAAPSQLNPATPVDLETIALRCLEKHPSRRFHSARELAEELERYLDGRPILTRPVGVFERAVRWARRQPLVAGLVALIGVIVILGTGASSYFGVQAGRRAEEERARRRELESILYRSQITQSDLEWQTDNINRADQLLDLCPPTLRNWEWGYLKRLCHAEQLAIRAPQGPARHVAYSPDGRRLVGSGEEQAVVLWDARTGRELHRWNCVASALAVAWSPSGELVAAGLANGQIAVWNPDNFEQRFAVSVHRGAVNDVAFHPSERKVVSCSEDGTVVVTDVSEQLELRVVLAVSAPVKCVAIDAKGKQLAAGGEAAAISVCDFESGESIQAFPSPASITYCLAFTNDGKQLLSGGDDQQIHTWDIASGRRIQSFEEHSDSVWSVALSPDGSQVASGGADGAVIVWRADSGELIRRWKAHHLLTYCIRFRPDGRQIVSSGIDEWVKMWDNTAAAEVPETTGHTERVNEVVYSPTGDRVASASRDGTVRLWDARTAAPLATFRGHQGMVLSVAFSRDGQWLVSGGEDGSVLRWSLKSGDSAPLGAGRIPAVWSVHVDPNQQFVAAGDEAGEIHLWDADSGQLVRSFPGHTGAIRCVRFSRDSRTLISCGDDGLIRLWDPATGDERRVLAGHDGRVWHVALSRDGGRLASSGNDGRVLVWNLKSFALEQSLAGHSGIVYSAAFSPNGSRLATAGFDQTIKIWSPTSGVELLTLRGHVWSVNTVAFSPDGTSIASGSSDSHVRIWHAVPWGGR